MESVDVREVSVERDGGAGSADDAELMSDAAVMAQGVEVALAAGRRGMTIIEIMVVMAIIGIIGTAVAFGVMGAFDDAEAQGDAIRVDKISKCLDLYRVKHREYPDRLETLLDGNCVTKEADLKDLQYEVVSSRRFKLCGPSAGEGKEAYCKE